jgi:ribosomal protein S18 acetylase RimI-like enzyme
MELRPATGDDLDEMIEVMFAEPGVEQVTFMLTIAGARRFTRASWLITGLDEFVVAEDDGEVVGFAWCSEDEISLRDGARAAVSGWGLTDPLRLVVKSWPRRRVEIEMPPGPKLIELQVHPARRGTGVGSALLGHLIEMVGDRPLSLTTRSNNPVRRLYERHGFEVVSQRNHRSFERRTGAQGRILMVRAGTAET